MSQIIYILTNESMPDLIKIGMTDERLDERVKELSRQTGVPLPFEVYFACEVENMREVERSLHDAFLDHRINPKKEFFRLNPERVISVLKLLQKKDVTPVIDVFEGVEEKNAVEIAKERRSRFNFDLAKIPVGSTVEYYYDNTIQAVVANDREITCNGETASLNQITLKLLKNSGRIWKSVQGPAFWLYEGETLDERRRRIENQD
ncbi:MAG: hypothetical protein RI935_680 [Candidatus Parcubacteria bacterium]|jgi:hypothetical protein